MLRKARSCLDNGGRLRVLTSNSILVEYSGDNYEYLGIFIEWAPFDNLLNLPIRLLTRPRPIAIVKAQPRNRIEGYVSLVARSREEAVKGSYEVRYKNVSEARLAKIIEAASKRGFERITIDVKPNVTIVTVLREDCHSIISSVRSFIEEVAERK